jgi:hypothetical protein
LKIKVIQGIFKQNIKPKCQIKWEEQYGGNIDWTQIWTKLKKIKVTNKVKEFQWKCLHNINYTEHRLKKMICQTEDAISAKLETTMKRCSIFFLNVLL